MEELDLLIRILYKTHKVFHIITSGSSTPRKTTTRTSLFWSASLWQSISKVRHIMHFLLLGG